jgi:hypothetical protein
MTKRSAWKQALATQMHLLMPRSEHTDDDYLRIVDELENSKLIQRPEHHDAQELWDALEPAPGDQIVEAVIVGKMVDFERGITSLSIAATDGVDWVGQLGMLHGALKIMNQSPLEPRDD